MMIKVLDFVLVLFITLSIRNELKLYFPVCEIMTFDKVIIARLAYFCTGKTKTS